MTSSALRHKTSSQKVAQPQRGKPVPANDLAQVPFVLRQTRAWLGKHTTGQAAALVFLLLAVAISAGLSLLVLMRMEDQQMVRSLPLVTPSPVTPPSFGITVTDQGAAHDVASVASEIVLPLDDGLRRALLDTSSRAVGRTVPMDGSHAPVMADDGNDIKTLRRAVRHNPRNASAQLALAQAFQISGDLDGAEETLLNALDHDSKSLRYHLALARLYDQMGRGRDALAEYRWLLNAPEAGRANFPLDDIANRAEFLASRIGRR